MYSPCTDQWWCIAEHHRPRHILFNVWRSQLLVGRGVCTRWLRSITVSVMCDLLLCQSYQSEFSRSDAFCKSLATPKRSENIIKKNNISQRCRCHSRRRSVHDQINNTTERDAIFAAQKFHFHLVHFIHIYFIDYGISLAPYIATVRQRRERERHNTFLPQFCSIVYRQFGGNIRGTWASDHNQWHGSIVWRW